MTDPRSSKIEDITARIKEAVGPTDGEVDIETVLARVRESIGNAANDVDTDAIVGRVKGAFHQVEGSVDAQRVREWVGGIDQDTVKGWLDDPKGTASTAAAFVSAQGERIADRAPGALDKLIGVAKEAIGDLTGNRDLARQGELQHLKGGIEERLAGASDTVEGDIAAATSAAKKNLGGTGS